MTEDGDGVGEKLVSELAAIEVGETVDGVVQVTIRRPDKGNALREIDHDAIAQVWATFDTRDEVRAIVVTGEGRLFSAGDGTQTG